MRKIGFGALVLFGVGSPAQPTAPRPKFDAFEVATIKPVEPENKTGRYIIMQGTNRFVEKNYTLKLLVAAAYDLNPKTISGGPGWTETDHYDILAVTPGDVRPTHDEQMSMLRNLLAQRFKITFHREQKQFSIYLLEPQRVVRSSSAAGPLPMLPPRSSARSTPSASCCPHATSR